MDKELMMINGVYAAIVIIVVVIMILGEVYMQSISESLFDSLFHINSINAVNPVP